MKTFFVILAAFSLAFIIGCQESAISDPISNDTELNLVLKFQIDKEVVTLVSMELKKVPGLLPTPDPEM